VCVDAFHGDVDDMHWRWVTDIADAPLFGAAKAGIRGRPIIKGRAAVAKKRKNRMKR
jgi:hypothetical protein